MAGAVVERGCVGWEEAGQQKNSFSRERAASKRHAGLPWVCLDLALEGLVVDLVVVGQGEEAQEVQDETWAKKKLM